MTDLLTPEAADAIRLPFGTNLPSCALAEGPNRSSGHCQLSASTDLEAIKAWMQGFRESPQTLRAYRKETERFLNWVFLVKQQPFSAVTRDDLAEYELFMANPQPVADWCAPRYLRRNDRAWRPFEGPLARHSRDYALSVLGSLFAFLHELGYLSGNPLARARRHLGSKVLRDELPATPPGPRYLTLPLCARVREVLEAACDSVTGNGSTSERERELFVFRFMVNTGIRREEFAAARNGDRFLHINASGNSLVPALRVVGKGAKERYVYLNESALDALERYQKHMGVLPSQPGLPLILNLSGTRADTYVSLEHSRVYAIVGAALGRAKCGLQPTLGVEDNNRLQAATPHWLRRTYATIALEQGVGLKHVQSQLGHSAASTTLTYQFSELSQRAAAATCVQI